MKLKLFILCLWFCRSGLAVSIPWIDIADTINPGTADYILSRIAEAEQEKAPYLVLRLDTPGGLLSATREIVQGMLNSPVPIVVYVAPQGAQAGSAGALITFAADVAVMAPGSNIGAAHPVVGGEQKVDKVMTDKMANDTSAFAESLAVTKKRNAAWAILAVKESASITAEAALKNNVIDLIAADSGELADKLKAYPLRVAKGQTKRLPAETPTFEKREMNLKQRFVSFFSNPNVAYILMSFAGLCFWVELTNPGLLFPGILGAICAILSAVAFQFLPIHWGAMSFVILGLVLIIAEAFVPSFGALGLGGIVSFIFGSIFLMDTSVPALQISLYVILPIALILGLSALVLVRLVWKSRRLPIASGTEALLGLRAQVREPVSKTHPGKVFVEGELWNACTEREDVLGVGTEVVVKEVRGLLLVVEGT